jgi:hypothetical protein
MKSFFLFLCLAPFAIGAEPEHRGATVQAPGASVQVPGVGGHAPGVGADVRGPTLAAPRARIDAGIQDPTVRVAPRVDVGVPGGATVHEYGHGLPGPYLTRETWISRDNMMRERVHVTDPNMHWHDNRWWFNRGGRWSVYYPAQGWVVYSGVPAFAQYLSAPAVVQQPAIVQSPTVASPVAGPYYEDAQGFYTIDGEAGGAHVYDPTIRRIAQ